MTTKTYFAFTGYWGDGNVYVNTHDGNGLWRLDPRLDLRNHSPSGLAWGYQGSGPAQLALALLADATGDDGLAQQIYQVFKKDVIAKLDQDNGWELTQDDILKWVHENAGRITGFPETDLAKAFLAPSKET